MADSPSKRRRECVLIYDGQCRLCMTVKGRLEKQGTEVSGAPVRMIAYQSEEAKRLLGPSYSPGPPEVALLVGPDGDTSRGLDAFLPFLKHFKGGETLRRVISYPCTRRLALFLYRVLARNRYRLFGAVSSDD